MSADETHTARTGEGARESWHIAAPTATNRSRTFFRAVGTKTRQRRPPQTRFSRSLFSIENGMIRTIILLSTLRQNQPCPSCRPAQQKQFTQKTRQVTLRAQQYRDQAESLLQHRPYVCSSSAHSRIIGNTLQCFYVHKECNYLVLHFLVSPPLNFLTPFTESIAYLQVNSFLHTPHGGFMYGSELQYPSTSRQFRTLSSFPASAPSSFVSRGLQASVVLFAALFASTTKTKTDREKKQQLRQENIWRLFSPERDPGGISPSCLMRRDSGHRHLSPFFNACCT